MIILLLHDSSQFLIYNGIFVMCLTEMNWLADASIDQSIRHGRLWVTSPADTNTPHNFGRLHARCRESEKANVVINIAIYIWQAHNS